MNLDLDAVVAGYEHTTLALLELASELSDAEWDAETAIPNWTVADQVAHVIGIERELLGDPLDPDVDTDGGHLHAHSASHAERAVAARRGTSHSALAAELNDVIARRQLLLHAEDRPGEDDLVASVRGREKPFKSLLASRILDLWSHEQDIRRATGRSMMLQGPAADVAFGVLLDRVPKVLRSAWTAPGQRVRLVIDGIATEFEAAEGGAVERVHPAGPGGEAPSLTLKTTWADAALLATGRSTADDISLDVTGDAALATRVLDAMRAGR